MSDSSSLDLGLVIYSAVKPIFKIYFIIAIGFYLAKRNILSVSTCRDISDTVVTAIMPCLIFNNIVSNLKSSDIKNIGIIIFTSALLFTFGGLLAYGIHIITKSPKRWLGGLISVGIFPNISDLPIAYLQTFAKGGVIFTTAQGEKGVAYVCIFLMAMVMCQFSFGLFRLIDSVGVGADKFRTTQNGSNSDSDSIISQAVASDRSDIEEEEEDQHNQFLKTRQNKPISPGADCLSTSDLRRQRSQNVQDVINEYSEFDALRSNEVQRTRTATSEIAVEPSVKAESKVKNYLKQLYKNVTTPSSLSLIISIAIAMAPPLKAFYVGAASVPLGLILLGTTLARLQVKKMPPGFWKTALLITIARLIIIPIFGVGVTTGFYKGGWYGSDILVRFVSVLEFGLPNATSLVYFTAFYTDPLSEEHLQMDCLAICLICQYAILWITLPFLTTFTLKVSMGL
ncbi:Membrane transport family protein [Candida albicans]|uniref:Membrane transport family protein n=1 Tax=Candida albicans TaxID=5476 RepID=A0A8H6BWH5_CANAX|nr:Membrane transport family protein [Candida albicans]